jgi:hypothetical protein
MGLEKSRGGRGRVRRVVEEFIVQGNCGHCKGIEITDEMQTEVESRSNEGRVQSKV